MTTINTDPSVSPQDHTEKKLTKSNPRKLFPSFTIMVVAVVVTIFLNIICGIKVMSLDAERNQLMAEKTSLDEQIKAFNREIKAHSTLLNELPGLKNQHIELTSKIANLQGELSSLTTRKAAFDRDYENMQSRLNDIKADSIQTESTAKAVRKETGELNSSISTLRSDKSRLEIQVAHLQKDVTEYESRISERSTQVRSLDAEIVSLKKTRDMRREQIDEMMEEKGKIQALSNKFDKITTKIETSGQQLTDTTSALKRSTEDAQKTIKEFDRAATSSKGAIKLLDESNEKFSKISDDLNQDHHDVRTAIVDFVRTSTDGKRQMEQLVSQMNEPLKMLNEQTRTLAEEVKNVGLTQTELAANVDRLKGNNQQMGSLQEQVKKKINELEENSEKLLNITKEIEAVGQNLKVNASDLEPLRQKAANSLEKLDTQLKSITPVFENFTKVMSKNFQFVDDSTDRWKKIDMVIPELQVALTEAIKNLKLIEEVKETASKTLQDKNNN